MTTEFLDPGRKLVDEVVDWLCGTRSAGRIRTTPEGAASLDHVMVVVPTAQSGRNVRLALAKRFAGKGVIPPRIVQPAQLVTPAKSTLREATSAETAAAFQCYVKENKAFILGLAHLVRADAFDSLAARFSLLDQLEDIWRILAGRGLLMRDVPALGRDVFEQDIGDEGVRWTELAALEDGFFAYLAARGLAYPTRRVHDAKKEAKILPDDIEEIVLPALADPIRVLEDVLQQQIAAGKRVTVLLHAEEKDRARFDEWGRPVTAAWTGRNRPVLSRLADTDIVTTSQTTSLARQLAADYPPADSETALPALALCDGTLYNALAGTFLAKGYVVHNPERQLLAHSSLGRLMRRLIVLGESDALPWDEFVLFFRSDDVLSALGLTAPARAEVLDGLDRVQRAYVPVDMPDGFVFPADEAMRPSDREKCAAFCAQARRVADVFSEARRQPGLTGFVRFVLTWVFARRGHAHGANEKEFRAAAEAARTLLNELEAAEKLFPGASRQEEAERARRGLGTACYSLEPDRADAVRTTGWLELAWTDATCLALAGLHEGSVPDSVVGHPFLPDTLRKALGLTSNDDRLARDTWLLTELLASHAPHAVRAYLARTRDNGDICRPSRLLYLCDDAVLPARIDRLFGETPEPSARAVRMVDWPLALPDRVEVPGHFSPSVLDAYVRCPFTYLLACGLKMRPYREKHELGADDFGTLAHAALERYAQAQIARGDDQLTDAAAIRAFFAEQAFPEMRRKYAHASLNVELQLQALEGRLRLFADVQAEWARQGWRIRMTEREIPKTLAVPGLAFRVHGYIDRVDENIDPACTRPWCILDYKTWDRKERSKHICTTGAKHVAFAKLAGYPLAGGKRRMLTVQLPVYGKCLAALEPRAVFAAQQFRYLVLGQNQEETGFEALTDDDVDASIDTANRAAEHIRANRFWPPGPSEDWRWDFGGLFVEDPLTDLADSAWACAHSLKTEAEHD